MAEETNERWRRINAIFAQAMDVPVEDRAAFLDTACAGDAARGRELARLRHRCPEIPR